MYLLFECGTCSRPYQLQVEKITVTLQKAVCNSCQTSYFFGPADQTPDALEPMIERIMSVARPVTPNKSPSTAKLPAYQVLWKCGICESIYQFNLNRVTEDGIKITCMTCFQFFILQKTTSVIDIDFLLLQDDRGQSAPRYDSVYPTKSESNTNVYEIEVSEEVLSQISEPPIDSKPTLSKTEELLSEIPEPESTSASAFKRQITQPEAQVPASEEPTITKKIIVPSPSLTSETNPRIGKRPPIVIQDNDIHLMNSFKSFNTKKAEFKIAKTNEATSVTFVDNFPARKKTFLEKNMIKISVWAIGLSIVGLTTVLIYEWYQARQEKNVIERAPVVPTDETPNKPRYGFPELGE